MTDKPDNVIPFRPKKPKPSRRSSMGYYVLVGHEPQPCHDIMTWTAEFQRRSTLRQDTGVDPWRVGYTEINDDINVSTVFLALDHSFSRHSDPLLFETMIFKRDGAELPDGRKVPDDLFDYQTRCGTWNEAEVMHEAAVAYARAQLKDISNG